MTVRKLLLSLILIPTLVSCIEESKVIKLKRDGSGTIVVTTTINAGKIAMIRQMTGEMGQSFGGQEQQKEPWFLIEQGEKNKASEYGKVTFVSAEKIKTAEVEGIKATYAFADITEVKSGLKPAGPKPQMGDPQQKVPPEEIFFRFATNRDGTAVLTVFTPEQSPERPEKKEEKKTKNKQAGNDELEMLKEMLGGFKSSVSIEVEGKIVKTNGAYVDGSKVTLFEIDFDQLLSNPEKLNELMAVSPAVPLETAKKILKDVTGAKVHLESELTIEFK